jgi:hypothetical protein
MKGFFISQIAIKYPLPSLPPRGQERRQAIYLSEIFTIFGYAIIIGGTILPPVGGIRRGVKSRSIHQV